MKNLHHCGFYYFALFGLKYLFPGIDPALFAAV